MASILIGSAMMLGVAFMMGACISNPGSIRVDGYAHGFILCGEANRGGFLMINNGHYHDPEVSELMALAAETCGGDPELYSQFE